MLFVIKKKNIFVSLLLALSFVISLFIGGFVANAQENNIYIVKSGDTLSKIAKVNHVSLTSLIALNNIKNPNRIYVGEKIVLSAPPTSSASPAPIQKSEPVVAKLKSVGDSQQVILVTTSSFSTVDATVQTFEKDNGVWNAVSSFPGEVGVQGMGYDINEGTKKTPIGTFSLGTAFGKYDNPGTKMAYRKTTSNDYWVDDVNSAYYNTWQIGPANGRWNSAENLLRSDSLYDYAIAINYNTSPIVKGKGSAFFVHVWSGPGRGTAGCTSMSKDNLLGVLRWLDPNKHPIIIQTPDSELSKM